MTRTVPAQTPLPDSGSAPDAFRETLLDRLAVWVGRTTAGVRSTGNDVSDGDIRSGLELLVGDREALADAINREVDRMWPMNDGDETSKGVWTAIAYLFGEEDR